MTDAPELLIKNAKLFLNGQWSHQKSIGLKNGKIVYIGDQEGIQSPESSKVINAEDRLVSAGLIDSHTHGAIGFDFMTASIEDLKKLLAWYASHGVTTVIPTLSAGLKTEFFSSIKNILKAKEIPHVGAKILGIHIEGPIISEEKKGAQPVGESLANPVNTVFDYLDIPNIGVIIMSLAPEIDGALEIIPRLVADNVICSIGHSNSSYETAMKAIDLGVTRSTHTFNAQSSFNHRAPGIIGAVFNRDEVFAEIILDGQHVHPGAARALLHAKGIDKVVLVSDSNNATGLGDGEFIRPGNRHVTVKDGAARLENGGLAGSVLLMRKAILNAMEFFELPISSAIKLATGNAAKSLNLKDIGEISVGKSADLIIHEDQMKIFHTIVEGRIVFSN